MKLNYTIRIRITTEMKEDIKKISEQLGFKESDLLRFLINRSITQLKTDSINAGGLDKLEFTLRHNRTTSLK